MEEVLGLLVAMLVGAAAILAVPISLMVLWTRTRRLRERVDVLESALETVQRVLTVPNVPTVLVPEVPTCHAVPECVPNVPEVRTVSAVPPTASAPALAPEHLQHQHLQHRWHRQHL